MPLVGSVLHIGDIHMQCIQSFDWKTLIGRDLVGHLGRYIPYFSDHKTHHDFFVSHFRKIIIMNVF